MRPAPVAADARRRDGTRGPLFGEDVVNASDNDLTNSPGGEPVGERIIVTGRVTRLRGDGRSAASWWKSGRPTRPAGTVTASITTPRRSTPISPGPGAV